MSRSPTIPLIVIAAVVAASAGAFAYTAGWLSPNRLTAEKLVNVLAPPGGPALGHRRNHAKGICFTGTFEANGAGADISRAQVFTKGKYPVIGRLNLATADPTLPDAKGRVRGIGIRIATPDGQEWRSAMITAPVFPVATPQDFYDLQATLASKDPGAVKTFAAGHPAFGAFAQWAGSAPWMASYAENRFNSLNSFIFTNAAGAEHAVRWSLVPDAAPAEIAPDDLAKQDPDFLEKEITDRVKAGPVAWKMTITLADPGDPTADPTKAWPDSRKTVDVGTLTAEQIIPEPHGPCRDINYDPTVLPDGIYPSDDPFPAARSAAYAVSFNRRAAEAKDYPAQPGTSTGATP